MIHCHRGSTIESHSHTGCGFSWHLKCIRCTWLGEGAVPSSIPGLSGQSDGLQKISEQDTTKFKNKSKTHKSLQDTGLFGAIDKSASRRLDLKTEQIGFVFPVRIANQTFQAANPALLSFQRNALYFLPQPTILADREVLSVKIHQELLP